MSKKAKQSLTDGDHYRAIKAALDGLFETVNVAIEAGLDVCVHATLETSEENWSELDLWVERKIGEASP
jgi:hypothetical protein